MRGEQDHLSGAYRDQSQQEQIFAAVAPVCDLTGPDAVCPGSTNEYCVTDQTDQTYIWSVTGDAAISGSATDPCVDIVADVLG